jgi:hypothetical protein
MHIYWRGLTGYCADSMLIRLLSQVLVPDQLVLSSVPSAKLQQRLVQKGCTLYLAVSILVGCVCLACAPCRKAAATVCVRFP